MTPRTAYCLEKAVECDRAAQRVYDHELKMMYLDLVKQWRDIAEQAEILERMSHDTERSR
jgi:hypothetical protein